MNGDGDDGKGTLRDGAKIAVEGAEAVGKMAFEGFGEGEGSEAKSGNERD
ncbi:MAG: hypothetical protein LKKZDAJK_000354 [Candidatus Fervidibacter sp.]